MKQGVNLLRTSLLLCLFLGVRALPQTVQVDVARIDRDRILTAAEKFLKEAPTTITSFPAPRSAGGLHEYFSEGDYWWPDPGNPDGPYIQKDGLTNPGNFVAHRQALIRFSVRAATLAAAYNVSGEKRFATQAAAHLRAWFLDKATAMYPHLKYAQAIKGKVTGRGVGIIDTIHLIEVAKSVPILAEAAALTSGEIQAIKKWFHQYLDWITTHQYGIDERNAKNNHGTCWVMQVAVFADVVGDEEKLDFCRKRFKQVLLPTQMGTDGSFPLELERTKPYNYSLFNLEAMAAICQTLSSPKDNLWEFTLPDGRGMRKAMEYMYPYIADKSTWPYLPDVMYYEYWPVRQAALLFAGMALDEPKYIALWKTLDPDPANEEVVRNFPLRQPLLWLHIIEVNTK